MSKANALLVYHWRAWRGFLVSHMVAEYCQLEAGYHDNFDTIARFLTPNIKAVLPQINLTDASGFPKHKNALLNSIEQQGIKVLNRQTDNITKHHLHQILQQAGLRCAKASKHGDPDQQLFLKTNLNWGGELERRLPAELVPRFYDEANVVIPHWDQYQLKARQHIPEHYWDHPEVVIENYIHNEQQRFFRVYGFGCAIVVVQAFNPALIKKIINHERDQNFCCYRDELPRGIAGLPDDLMAQITGFVQACPLDYFCLDIVHNATEYVIIDLNLTPYSGLHEHTSRAADFLREGAASCCGF